MMKAKKVGERVSMGVSEAAERASNVAGKV